MLKKMQRAAISFKRMEMLKHMAGERTFQEGITIVKNLLQMGTLKDAEKTIIKLMTQAVLEGDIEKAKSFAVALEVLKDYKKNQKN
jgi:hypothetical protein